MISVLISFFSFEHLLYLQWMWYNFSAIKFISLFLLFHYYFMRMLVYSYNWIDSFFIVSSGLSFFESPRCLPNTHSIRSHFAATPFQRSGLAPVFLFPLTQGFLWGAWQLAQDTAPVTSSGSPLSLCCCCCKSWTTLLHNACSMPGSPVLHYLLEFVQIYVHWVHNAI